MNKNHKGKILAIATILAVLLTVAYYWNAGRISADSHTISFPIVHAGTEVDSIANMDFVVIHNAKCLGLSYNDNGWTVEYILGEYTIESTNNMVDFSDIIGCKRTS